MHRFTSRYLHNCYVARNWLWSIYSTRGPRNKEFRRSFLAQLSSTSSRFRKILFIILPKWITSVIPVSSSSNRFQSNAARQLTCKDHYPWTSERISFLLDFFVFSFVTTILHRTLQLRNLVLRIFLGDRWKVTGSSGSRNTRGLDGETRATEETRGTRRRDRRADEAAASRSPPPRAFSRRRGGCAAGKPRAISVHWGTTVHRHRLRGESPSPLPAVAPFLSTAAVCFATRRRRRDAARFTLPLLLPPSFIVRLYCSAHATLFAFLQFACREADRANATRSPDPRWLIPTRLANYKEEMRRNESLRRWWSGAGGSGLLPVESRDNDNLVIRKVWLLKIFSWM